MGAACDPVADKRAHNRQAGDPLLGADWRDRGVAMTSETTAMVQARAANSQLVRSIMAFGPLISFRPEGMPTVTLLFAGCAP
jgi:hypothetical protein